LTWSVKPETFKYWCGAWQHEGMSLVDRWIWKAW